MKAQKKVLFLKPSKSLSLKCFGDLNFADLYGIEENQYQMRPKSHNEYIITFARYLLPFVSKLLTEVVVSTLHVEHISLSQSLYELLEMKSLVTKASSQLKDDISKMKVASKFAKNEANNDACIVVTCQ